MDSEALTAVKTGDPPKLKELLDRGGIDINAQDANGRTLLHHATSNGHHEVVKCLLQNGADVLVTTHKNNTALHIALIAKRKDDALVKAILENVPRGKLRKLLETRTKVSGSAALHVAAKNDSHANASLLLEHGANFEVTNDAGEKPADLTRSDELRGLFQLIAGSFAKAKSGDRTLANLDLDLDQLNARDFTSATNCRNGEGRTIVQVLVLNEHYRLANALLWLRVNQPTSREQEPLRDPRRKHEVDELARGAREFREFWEKQEEDMENLAESMKNEELANVEVATSQACKLCARAVEKAHEVLLAYRRFEGKEKALTADPRMKTLEEALEALGFDPEQLHVDVNREECYYEKLPAKWRENLKSLMVLMHGVIDSAIDFYLGHIYAVQTFTAAKDDDIDKIQQLINYNVINHGVDANGRTPLCYAVENESEKMVQLLLKNGASVSRATAESPIYTSARKNNAKIVRILLKRMEHWKLAEYIDYRQDNGSTALHAAARHGNLEIVKRLLRYGATYGILDSDERAPLDLTTDQEVSDFLKLVDECFQRAKKGDAELIPKLEAMQIDDFLAVAKTRNLEGKTLAEVATKAKAKKIAEVVSKMVLDEGIKRQDFPYVLGKKYEFF